ncbi:hypothetical protein BGZ76_011861 [Entomortierella beljakovae]|nr:hypothetical protein BGZ76_011861 [Entomortierella beljakovae]
MLQYAPRLTAQIRQKFLKPIVFPRRPLFFSTTARHFTNGHDSTITGNTANEEVDEKPTPTDLESHPDSISCVVTPPETYAFLKPTPVVLLTGPFGGNWCYRDTWQATLADQGYHSTSIEFTMPTKKLETGDDYIRHFTKVLKTSIETDHSFYPPIMIAHGLHALVAQKYVESNPVSALILVAPFIPKIVKNRFSELSYKLKLEKEGALESPDQVIEPSEYHFKTHSDILAQTGFRERFVLPKKAVYKIDQVAKELREKTMKIEAEQKEKVASAATDGTEPKTVNEEQKYGQEKEQESTGAGGESGVSDKNTSSSILTASAKASEAEGDEKLGTDSVPVWGSAASGSTPTGENGDNATNQADNLPEMIVEPEASIPSTLEHLPVAIYDSIPTSIFEPTFPILLITSNGDEIVSTADIKEHHVLSGEVDHIELEDIDDDGGHLIMVADNTEWEQGIQGITAWLDSNGM